MTHSHYVHMDIAGVMSHKTELPYLSTGMSGKYKYYQPGSL